MGDFSALLATLKLLALFLPLLLYAYLPLMILLLNGETQLALDWLTDAEETRWLEFQPLLSSPVYAEFREMPEVAAALERMTAWRAGVLEEVLAMELPEVGNPDLLLEYMESLARPSHHDRARIALHFDDDPAGALGHYERALQEDPENVMIIEQASILALEFGLVEEAVRLQEHAANIAPDDAGLPVSIQVFETPFDRYRFTDAQGRATVELKLPDSLTRYRVMAVAVAGGRIVAIGDLEEIRSISGSRPIGLMR